MTEHRLEDILPISDRLYVLDKGAILAEGSPQQVGAALNSMNHPMFLSMPSPMQIHAGVSNSLAAPVTVKEGRQWLNAYLADKTAAEMIEPKEKLEEAAASIAIQLKDVWFKHDKSGPDIIKDLSFTVREGQFYCIVGGNGTGKTTTLSLISSILQPYRGKVLIGGKNPSKMSTKELFTKNVGILPQNPQTLFVKKTVELDLYEMLSQAPLTKAEKEEKVEAVVRFAELEHLLAMHPYDLSGGEQQRAALAKVLLLEPKILLLDEPTKGLDGFFKEKLAAFLQKLNDNGVTIVMVSHDIEFCAKYGEVCSMFFDGSIITTNKTNKFFAGNSFYTTAANRMARHIWKDGVTIEGVIELCQRSR